LRVLLPQGPGIEAHVIRVNLKEAEEHLGTLIEEAGLSQQVIGIAGWQTEKSDPATKFAGRTTELVTGFAQLAALGPLGLRPLIPR
jgi:hypothetical protein